MSNTIPEKALVALPDFSGGLATAWSKPRVIVSPEHALVPAFDRSFHFGDSMYEVTRSYEGILFSVDEHLHRLTRSAELGMFEILPNQAEIKTMIHDTCRAFFKKFGNRDIYVRVTLSRGVGDLNIDRRTSGQPYVVIFVKELETYAARLWQEGVHYAVVSRQRNHPKAIDPAMKSGNYLNNILALTEAQSLGASDAVMLNHDGFVTEGTTNNVHMVKNGEVWTAPLSVGILAGITRDWLFQICRREKIAIHERLYTEQDLKSCDEMFLSSATKEVMPITTLNSRPVGNGQPGAVTRKLHTELKKLILEYCAKYRADSLYL